MSIRSSGTAPVKRRSGSEVIRGRCHPASRVCRPRSNPVWIDAEMVWTWTACLCRTRCSPHYVGGLVRDSLLGVAVARYEIDDLAAHERWKLQGRRLTERLPSELEAATASSAHRSGSPVAHVQSGRCPVGRRKCVYPPRKTRAARWQCSPLCRVGPTWGRAPRGVSRRGGG